MATLKNTTINDTGFLQIGIGTTAQRPSNPEPGMIRFNTDLGFIESWNSNTNEWRDIIAATPAGAVRYFALNSPPTGWIKANGAAISRTTYSALFSAIGTTFGSGNGSTTFNLPDLRGEFIRCWDDGRGVDSGRSFGSTQGDAIRNITGTMRGQHQNNTGIFLQTSFTGPFTTSNNSSSGRMLSDFSYSGTQKRRDANFNASNVVPTANENRPRNLALLACIKY